MEMTQVSILNALFCWKIHHFLTVCVFVGFFLVVCLGAFCEVKLHSGGQQALRCGLLK